MRRRQESAIQAEESWQCSDSLMTLSGCSERDRLVGNMDLNR